MIKKTKNAFQRFVEMESFSGILLLAATIIALIWANSPFGDSYQALWTQKFGVSFGSFELKKDLILWINDGLMAIFFFLIGLEIKREFLIGELNSPKKIAFPLIGAIGGMIAPIVMFLLLNENPETTRGWGIPMATDIAFSLAVLNVLGKRVPLALKVFLTAFAIVDDLGAVLVIAVFFTTGLKINMLLIALGLLAFLYFLSYRNLYSKGLNIFIGVIIWYLFLKSGIHPTIAGVLLAFAVPISQKITTDTFLSSLNKLTDKIRGAKKLEEPILSNEQLHYIDDMEDWANKYKSPLQNLEHKLHGVVANVIIPIFALANAGVAISSDATIETNLVISIMLALIIGKSIGVTLFVTLTKKLKIISVPKDITFRHIIGVAFLAGIGFTMAIFIAGLAFTNPAYIDSAKIGILIGSLVSAIIGFIILKTAKPANN
ncbi:MAG: Na+/H+ antiporter NhaA [Tenacibaculum sp.]|nr:Na+/H+ antiporter NhaA [Tenacibaculum sp.]